MEVSKCYHVSHTCGKVYKGGQRPHRMQRGFKFFPLRKKGAGWIISTLPPQIDLDVEEEGAAVTRPFDDGT